METNKQSLRERALEDACENLVVCIRELIESIHSNTSFKTNNHRKIHELNMRRIENRIMSINGTVRRGK